MYTLKSLLKIFIIEKANDNELTVEQLTPVLSTWVNKIRQSPSKPEHLELYKDLLQYFLGSREHEDMHIQKELLRTLYKYLRGLKEKASIDNWVSAHIEHLPSNLLMVSLQRRKIVSKKLCMALLAYRETLIM